MVPWKKSIKCAYMRKLGEQVWVNFVIFTLFVEETSLIANYVCAESLLYK